MNAYHFGALEVLVETPSMPTQETPLLFVHGAYVAAWCWAEHFMPWFAAHGWHCHALSLSGHGASRQREHLDTYSIDDYVNDVAEVVASLPAAPVLIGHSMGGLVVQKYLETRSAPAAVLMSSVPPQGLLGSAVNLLLQRPNLLADLNNIMNGNDVSLSSLREALFHQPIAAADLERYYRLSQPESHRAIWDMSLFNLPNPSRIKRSLPLQVIGAEFDTLIPPGLTRQTAAAYDVDAHILPGMGHGMMLEQDWQHAALLIADWLKSLQLR